MLRLAIVTHFPDDPQAPNGGVEAVSVNLVRAFSEFDDLQIDVITSRRSYTESTKEQWGKVTIHRLRWAGGSVLYNAIGPGRKQLQDYLDDRIKPDVVNVLDTYGIMAKGMNIPRVLTIHGFIYGDVLVSGSRFSRLRSLIWRCFEMGGWADHKHIISISPYVKERLDGIVNGNIYDIDNPISGYFFDIERKESKAKIFCAAAIIPRKNQLAIVEAAAKLVSKGIDVELRLAGSLDEGEYVKQVRDRIKQYGLEKQVLLLGRLGTEQIREELSEASVFTLVSLEENSPMGIEEAMAAGIPIVTSNRCGMPYMVRDGESGFLVDPNDVDDIAERLGQVLSDDELRRSMGVKGRQIALERFHPARVAARTRQIYLQIAKS